MKKIIIIGLLIFIGFLAVPIKKRYKLREHNNYYKTHYKVDAPELITRSKKTDDLNIKKGRINYFDQSHEYSKLDFTKIKNNTPNKKLTVRHHKGKIVYNQKMTIQK